MKLYDLTELSPAKRWTPTLDQNIPVRGGWGYSAEDACIIDKNDPIIDPDGPMPFYGVGFEKIFVERRINMELITFRPEAERHLGIQWIMLSQSLMLSKAYPMIISNTKSRPSRTRIGSPSRKNSKVPKESKNAN